MKKQITANQFHELTRPLIGLPVSRAWRGFGSAIFLKLGELTEETRKRKDGSLRTTSKGQITVMIKWSWRVERPQSIWFGSWSGNRKITNGIAKLKDTTVLDVTIEGRLPELVVQLSGGLWVHSFTTTDGQLEWSLLFHWKEQPVEWINSEKGKLYLTSKD